jgi:CrcB protein
VNGASRRRQAVGDLCLVALGAVPGALLRWWLTDTLTANLLGCLVMGMVLGLSRNRPALMLVGGVGFCGSLTTFSAWILALARSLQAGRVGEAMAGVTLPLAGGLGLLVVGLLLGLRVDRTVGRSLAATVEGSVESPQEKRELPFRR